MTPAKAAPAKDKKLGLPDLEIDERKLQQSVRKVLKHKPVPLKKKR